MYIKKVSPSKLKSYDECKKKYKFRYVDHLRKTYNNNSNTDALHFGSYVHRILELGVEAKSVEELEKIAKEERANYTFPDSFEKRVPDMLKNFLQLNEKLTEHISAEQVFEIPITDDYAINGIIDRVVKGETGKYLVIDYKTSKRASTKRELFTDAQMIMYAYAISKMYNVSVSDVTCCHYYPHMDKLVSVRFTPSHVAVFLRKLTSKIWEIRKKKKSEFPPQLNQFCNWCNFKNLCPEFGGTSTMLEEAISDERSVSV